MGQVRRSRTLFCGNAKKLSIAALSPGCVDPAHGTGQPVACERTDELCGPELTRSSRTTQQGDVVTPGDGVGERGDSEAGLHLRIDGVTTSSRGTRSPRRFWRTSRRERNMIRRYFLHPDAARRHYGLSGGDDGQLSEYEAGVLDG